MLHCWIASSIPPQSNNFSANHNSSFANFSGKSASATFLGYIVALLSGLEVHGLTEYNTCVISDGILTRGARKPILEPIGKFFRSRLQTETNKKKLTSVMLRRWCSWSEVYPSRANLKFQPGNPSNRASAFLDIYVMTMKIYPKMVSCCLRPSRDCPSR